MQTLQFPLGWFRLFCGQEPAVSSLAQSSGLFSLFYLSVIETDSISFSHTLEKKKGSCQCWCLSERITKNKPSTNNRALSSAQIKCLLSQGSSAILTLKAEMTLNKGAAACQGELYKRYFCNPGIKNATELYLYNSEDSFWCLRQVEGVNHLSLSLLLSVFLCYDALTTDHRFVSTQLTSKY